MYYLTKVLRDIEFTKLDINYVKKKEDAAKK
jgi:hypothetical protein